MTPEPWIFHDLSSSFIQVPHSAVEGCRKKHPHLHLLANSPSAWESKVNDRHDVNDLSLRMVVWSMVTTAQGCGKSWFLFFRKKNLFKKLLAGIRCVRFVSTWWGTVWNNQQILPDPKPFTIYQVSRECRLMSSESKDGTTPLHLQHRSLDLWQLLWRMKTA